MLQVFNYYYDYIKDKKSFGTLFLILVLHQKSVFTVFRQTLITVANYKIFMFRQKIHLRSIKSEK